MEYDHEDQYGTHQGGDYADNRFVELPIHRVKKKRVLTEKQKANWQKALEARKKNIAMRQKAKMEMSQLEKEQLMSDPDLKNREKRLKDILLTILSMEEGTIPTTLERPGITKVQRIKHQEPEIDLADERDVQEHEVEEDEPKYQPLISAKRMDNAKKKVSNREVVVRKWADESDDDDTSVNIFKE